MSLRALRGRGRRIDEENPYWISFSDIMAGLLVIFILASLALILELTKTRTDIDDNIRELAQAEEARRQILREIQRELESVNIRVEVVDNDSVLRIPSETLTFQSNRHDILPDYIHSVLEIGRVLHAAINRGGRYQHLDTIFVEGHTDNLQTGDYYRSNWGLSAYRAIAVWNFWLDELGELRLGEMLNRDGDPLFSVSGYAETRPITMRQDTAEKRAQNRRIDLRFTVVRPEVERYEVLRERFR